MSHYKYGLALTLALIVGCGTAGTTTSLSADVRTDTNFLKIRYEHSNDLVQSMDGLQLYQVYSIRCNDGRDRPVKVALLDNGLQRVGIVVDSGVKIDGGRAYTPSSVAFVSLAWFQKAKQAAQIEKR